jgi:hypothetical protein
MSRWETAKKKIDNTASLLKLGLAVGSAWLFIRKLKSDQAAEQAAIQAALSNSQAAGASSSAAKPLVTSVASMLPTSVQNVLYGTPGSPLQEPGVSSVRAL